MAEIDVPQLGVDLESDRAAVALAGGRACGVSHGGGRHKKEGR
jgi:hypothetical protein